MSNLGSPKIDLTKFLSASPVHEINGVIDAMQLMNSVSMVSMKLGAENVESVKTLTTKVCPKNLELNRFKKFESISVVMCSNFQHATEFFT